MISERVMTEGDQTASSENRLFLEGDGSRANMVSRSVLKGTSRQDLKVNLVAKARCFGYSECDAILMDRGVNKTLPALEALHPDAELTHEASIGKIADDQLMKLMSLGLDYDGEVNRIIQAFLK